MTTTMQALFASRLEITGFGGIAYKAIDLRGNNLEVSGPNGCGKSSVLDAFIAALKLPWVSREQPINNSADRAVLCLDLMERDTGVHFCTLKRTLTGAGGRLEITAADGSTIRKPQEFADRIIGDGAMLQLGKLANAAANKTWIENILKVCNVLPPVAFIADITGERIAPLPGESAPDYLDRLVGKDRGIFYTRRTQIGQEMRRKESAYEEWNRQLIDAGGAPADGEEMPSTGAIMAEIEKRQAENAARATAMSEVNEMQQQYDFGARQLQALKGSTSRIDKDLADVREQMKRLAAREKELLQEKADVEAKVTKGTAELESWKREVLEPAKAQAAAMPDPTPRLLELKQQAHDIETVREKFSCRRNLADQVQRANEDRANARKQHADYGLWIERIRDKQNHLLDDADLGIPGLTITEGEARVRGILIQDLSTAERIEIAAEILCRQAPLLKIARLDGAEALDHATTERITRSLNAKGIQLLLSRVSDMPGDNGEPLSFAITEFMQAA